MALLLLLVLLWIVLLWKRHSREGCKVMTPLAVQNAVFEVNKPIHKTTSDSGTYYTEIHLQHDETHGNENYIEVHTEHNVSHGSESYETVAITVPTDTHLETHANEAYQTTAAAISIAAYGCQMANEDDYEENAAYI